MTDMDMAALTETVPRTTKEADDAHIQTLREHLSLSRTGKALLDWADENDIDIVIDHQLDPRVGGLYYPGTKTVALSANFTMETQATFLGHELRHAWQDSNGMLPGKADASPGDLMIRMRLMEADATAIQIQIAAELSRAGSHAAWMDLNSGDLHYIYKRAVDAYREQGEADIGKIDSGEAACAAFNGWFASPIKIETDYRMLLIYNTETEKRLGYRDVHARPPVETTFTSSPRPENKTPLHFGIDFRNREAMLKMSEMPAGGSYFPDLQSDYLEHDEVFGFSFGEYPLVQQQSWKAQDLARHMAEKFPTQRKTPAPAHR